MKTAKKFQLESIATEIHLYQRNRFPVFCREYAMLRNPEDHPRETADTMVKMTLNDIIHFKKLARTLKKTVTEAVEKETPEALAILLGELTLAKNKVTVFLSDESITKVFEEINAEAEMKGAAFLDHVDENTGEVISIQTARDGVPVVSPYGAIVCRNHFLRVLSPLTESLQLYVRLFEEGSLPALPKTIATEEAINIPGLIQDLKLYIEQALSIPIGNQLPGKQLATAQSILTDVVIDGDTRIPFKKERREDLLNDFFKLVKFGVLSESDIAYWLCADFQGFKPVQANRILNPKTNAGNIIHFVRLIYNKYEQEGRKRMSLYRRMLQTRINLCQNYPNKYLLSHFSDVPESYPDSLLVK